MPTIKLTQQIINAGLFTPPGKSRVELCDEEVRGMYIEVRSTSNGQRSEKFNKETPYTTITKVWDRIRNEAGIPHFRIHDARHLFCSWLVSSGVPIYSVMTLAGHADVKTTQRYAHLSTKALQDASASASIMIQSAMQGQIQSVTQMEFVPSEVLQGDVVDVVPVALPESLPAAELLQAA